MSKSTTRSENCNIINSDLTSSQLARPPIRRKTEDEDDLPEDEIAPRVVQNLYPSNDLKDELEEIKRQNVQNNPSRRQKSAAGNNPDRRQKIHLPKHDVKSEEEASKSSNFCSLRNIIIFLITFVTSLFAIYIYPEKPAAGKILDLTEFISRMKNRFEGQDSLTFHILQRSLKNVFNENSKPAAPSIITIITNKGAESTASDYCTYIAHELANDNFVLINESVFHRNPDSLKYFIDNKIKSTFNNGSLNVAIVDRLHNIPINAAMIFHNYCDHENAPFKQAIFLFIVHLSKKVPENSSPKFMDNIAMQALRQIWHDASEDIVDSLITRLTVSVINIK